MSRLRDYIAMSALSLMAGFGNQGMFDEAEFYNEPKFYCGGYKHCPMNGKTFCKVAKHHTTQITIANKCKKFEAK